MSHKFFQDWKFASLEVQQQISKKITHGFSNCSSFKFEMLTFEKTLKQVVTEVSKM